MSSQNGSVPKNADKIAIKSKRKKKITGQMLKNISRRKEFEKRVKNSNQNQPNNE